MGDKLSSCASGQNVCFVWRSIALFSAVHSNDSHKHTVTHLRTQRENDVIPHSLVKYLCPPFGNPFLINTCYTPFNSPGLIWSACVIAWHSLKSTYCLYCLGFCILQYRVHNQFQFSQIWKTNEKTKGQHIFIDIYEAFMQNKLDLVNVWNHRTLQILFVSVSASTTSLNIRQYAVKVVSYVALHTEIWSEFAIQWQHCVIRVNSPEQGHDWLYEDRWKASNWQLPAFCWHKKNYLKCKDLNV